MPYFVSRSAAPEVVPCAIAHCESLAERDLVSLQHPFGVSLLVTAGVALNR